MTLQLAGFSSTDLRPEENSEFFLLECMSGELSLSCERCYFLSFCMCFCVPMYFLLLPRIIPCSGWSTRILAQFCFGESSMHMVLYVYNFFCSIRLSLSRSLSILYFLSSLIVFGVWYGYRVEYICVCVCSSL